MPKVEVLAVLEKVKEGKDLNAEEKQAVMMGDISEAGVAVADPIPPVKKDKEKEEAAETDKITDGESGDAPKKDPDPGEEEEAGKEKSSDEVSTPPGDDKKTGEDAAKDTPKAEEWVDKSERELKKPEGEEDLTTFTPREKGLFYELRQQRRRAQRAEVEAREAEYKLFQERNATKENAKNSTPKELTEIFNGREDDDLLTVGEAKKVLEAAKKQPDQSITAPLQKQIVGMQFQLNLMKMQSKYPDAPQVVGLLDELLDNDDPYSKMAQEEVSAAYLRGGNFVQVAYNFVKGHPRFHEYEAKLKTNGSKADSSEVKDPDAEEKKARAEKLKENQNKTRTTGSAGGGESPRSGEYTEQELKEMTPEQWRKLPAKVRQRLLQG